MAVNRAVDFFMNKLELQKLDNHSKYTVFGYIREQKNLNKLTIIPQLVIAIILSFYADISDKFNPKLCGRHVTIEDDNNTIIENDGSWGTVYGERVISSLSNGLWIWKFKSIGYTTQGLRIGIDNTIAK